MLGAGGDIRAFGEASVDRSPETTTTDPAVSIVHVPGDEGYWVVTSRGRVHTRETSYTEGLGDCRRLGRGGVTSVTRATANSQGIDLWVMTREGGICAFDREG